MSYVEAASDIEPPQKKQKLSDADVKRIIMGEELTNVHINTARHLLKEQFPNLSGLQCTDKEMYHVKIAVIRWIITNIISYMHANNWMLIYAYQLFKTCASHGKTKSNKTYVDSII